MLVAGRCPTSTGPTANGIWHTHSQWWHTYSPWQNPSRLSPGRSFGTAYQSEARAPSETRGLSPPVRAGSVTRGTTDDGSPVSPAAEEGMRDMTPRMTQRSTAAVEQ